MDAMPILCLDCVNAAGRNSITLCATCSKHFRIVLIPSELAQFDNVRGEEDVSQGLMARVFAQQRELAKFNKRAETIRNMFTQRTAGWMLRVKQAMGITAEMDVNEPAVQDSIVYDGAKIIRRYQWLRNVRKIDGGGDALDALCDEGVRQYHGVMD